MTFPSWNLLAARFHSAHRAAWSFGAMWLFIVGVSAYDGYWVLANRVNIASEERNPIGRWLVALNGGDIWLLLAAKSGGTVLVSTLLLVLFWTSPQWGWIIAAALALVQLVLLVWLCCA